MTIENYEDYQRRWKTFFDKQEEYRKELEKWDNNPRDHRTTREIKEDLGIDEWGELEFGPFTVFYKNDLENLRDPEFILPGEGRSFKEMNPWGIGNIIIKNIEIGAYYYCSLTGELGKIVGFGYDYGDYYYVVDLVGGKGIRGCHANIRHEILGNPDLGYTLEEGKERIEYERLLHDSLHRLTIGTTNSLRFLRRVIKGRNKAVALQMKSWKDASSLINSCIKEKGMIKHCYSKPGNYLYIIP